MAHLRDVMVYICQHYPHSNELSKARLTKMVYLVDWRSAILYGHQVTDITWEFNHYGPYVEDIIRIAREDSLFTVESTQNMYGDFKEVISVDADADAPSLTEQDKEVIDFVIQTTKDKYWNAFMRLVYSTYPIVTESRFSKLDLVRLAEEYKERSELFDDSPRL